MGTRGEEQQTDTSLGQDVPSSPVLGRLFHLLVTCSSLTLSPQGSRGQPPGPPAVARPVTRPPWEAGGSDTVVIWDRGLLSPALVSTRNVRRRLGCPRGEGGGRDTTQRQGRDGAQTQGPLSTPPC